ncbi:MAG: phosphatidylserine decarboxylase family protein [Caldithrix sp.]|nr:phosphatidylserine decarboxylase family protein [Caldithrix sp.]
MITKEGYSIIGFTAFFLLIWLLLAFLWGGFVFYGLSIINAALLIFHFFFFRDPDRLPPAKKNIILAPADGTIIKIDSVEEPEYLKEKAQMVSIFMSVFNVHVNRIPVTGKVDYYQYREGQYLAAFNDRACEANEQTHIGIQTDHGKIFFKQIAGLIARRIVCALNMGDNVKQGERFGVIKYGSRVDIFIPLGAQVMVNEKDKVTAGQTIIGEWV